jgi:ATP-binding cassette, subfamily C (CFTR/MRP), member 1
VTFGVFVAIATVKKDHSILTAQAFTSLSLISLLTTPALMFIQAIPSMVQTLACFDRIQEYCRQPANTDLLVNIEQDDTKQPSRPSNESMIRLEDLSVPGGSDGRSESTKLSSIVSFHGQSFGWSKAGPAILKELSADIKANCMTVVLGPTGCGKSTLLESLLGETIALGGRCERNFSAAAYCSQVPWLPSGTIRDIILGGPGMPFDEKWYSSVLWACGLEADLDILPRRDYTAVGSSGSGLSGGQKQRIVSWTSLLTPAICLPS